MAILISKECNTREGSTIPSCYVRIETELSKDGCCLKVELYHYASKDAYLAGAYPVVKNIAMQFDYDRLVDGTDILTVSHDKVVAYLQENMGYLENELTIQDI